MSLHPHQRAAVKAATRAAIAALPAIGETQNQAAARVLGVGPDRLSRWTAEHVDELITFAAALRLESAAQMPVFASLFAAATGHRLVPDEGAAGGVAGLMAELCRFVGAHGSAVTTLSDALADGQVAPREAGAVLGALGDVKSVITGLERMLTAIRAGEGA